MSMLEHDKGLVRRLVAEVINGGDDAVYFFRVVNDRLGAAWGFEDTWARLVQLGTAEHAITAESRAAEPREGRSN